MKSFNPNEFRKHPGNWKAFTEILASWRMPDSSSVEWTLKSIRRLPVTVGVYIIVIFILKLAFSYNDYVSKQVFFFPAKTYTLKLNKVKLDNGYYETGWTDELNIRPKSFKEAVYLNEISFRTFPHSVDLLYFLIIIIVLWWMLGDVKQHNIYNRKLFIGTRALGDYFGSISSFILLKILPMTFL